MNALEWLRDFKQNLIRPVIVVFGDDSYLIRESIHAVVRAVFPDPDSEASVTRFAGSGVSLADVLDEVRTVPFFSRNRLVVVDEADPFVTKYRRDLEAYVANPFKSGSLLLQCKSWPGTTNLAKLTAATALLIDCGSPRESELAPWLIELAKTRFEARLDANAARQLIELVGPESGILAAEVEKLAVYAGSTARIERDDVIRLVGAGRVETIWKTLDAATIGQARAALVQLDNLLAAGEQPILALAAMSTNLLKLHHAGMLAPPGSTSMKHASSPVFLRSQSKKPASSTRTWVQAASASFPRCSCEPTSMSKAEPRLNPELCWRCSSCTSRFPEPTELFASRFILLKWKRLAGRYRPVVDGADARFDS